jgi:hypothetical protein
MLHENPLMLGIDVCHWRNLQTLLLESAKEKRRIVVIHQGGEILKFVHSGREEIVRSLDRVDDPRAAAERIYYDNRSRVDFVAVFERDAFDRYFGRWQGTWSPDEDLDAFVQRTYATLDEFPDGLVTFPGAARETLGLQWRIGASRDAVAAAAMRYVPAGSMAVFGIFDGEHLWATLLLGFDADRRVNVITTVDMSQIDADAGRPALARQVVGWVGEHYGPCSLALFSGLEGARAFLASEDKLAILAELSACGELIVERAPAELSILEAAPSPPG